MRPRSLALFAFAIAGSLAPANGAVRPTIFSTVVNFSTSQITSTGQNFSPHSVVPVVALDNTKLALVSFTDNSAVAALPSGLRSGSYRLTITNSEKQLASFAATIGAAGRRAFPARRDLLDLLGCKACRASRVCQDCRAPLALRGHPAPLVQVMPIQRRVCQPKFRPAS